MVSESESRSKNYTIKAALRSDYHVTKEELRKQHLARQKNEETSRRLAGFVAYKNVNDVPLYRELMIQVDQKHEVVLLPIYGSMVPFHVATIKTVSGQQDTNRNNYIRIVFIVPDTPFSPHDANYLKNQAAIYLKEVSFRSKDSRRSSEVVQAIKTLRRQVMARESERAERAILVSQEKLQFAAGNKFKPLRLSELCIYPPFTGRKKIHGTLETYANGFRYSTTRPDERVDVLFANIKHAFFQPAEREMITFLHFHLHNHIMVGNKKTKDVQFYTEVMDVVQSLAGGGRSSSAYDLDEVEEENRERLRKKKFNMDFNHFTNRVNDMWQQTSFDLEFDQPLRELGFLGVPHKTSAFIVPTSRCLVELLENPFLVVSLNEIEIVNLERVGFGQNFDMAIIFKDLKKDVLRVDSVPTSSLQGIKEWLDSIDIKYYESKLNLNWRQILKTITDDPQSFVDDGGWEFLNVDASDSESDGSEDSDKGYEPSDVVVESESDDEASESDEEEEEESEEERKRRKVKAFGKSRPGTSGGGGSSSMKNMPPSKRNKHM